MWMAMHGYCYPSEAVCGSAHFPCTIWSQWLIEETGIVGHICCRSDALVAAAGVHQQLNEEMAHGVRGGGGVLFEL